MTPYERAALGFAGTADPGVEGGVGGASPGQGIASVANANSGTRPLLDPKGPASSSEESNAQNAYVHLAPTVSSGGGVPLHETGGVPVRGKGRKQFLYDGTSYHTKEGMKGVNPADILLHQAARDHEKAMRHGSGNVSELIEHNYGYEGATEVSFPS